MGDRDAAARSGKSRSAPRRGILHDRPPPTAHRELMPLPVRPLPVLQNWDCRGCTDCCREYAIFLSPDERKRIADQHWESDPDLKGVKTVVRGGRWWQFWSRTRKLNHRKDGACVFLADDGRCRIHAKHGAAAKPLACRVYPFVLVPTGDSWRVGLRYACPSAAGDEGRPVNEHRAEINEYARALEEREGIAAGSVPPPPLHGQQTVEWPDLLQFVRALRTVLAEEVRPLEWRLRKCLALAALCRQARFDMVKGARLREFLELVTSGVEDDLPATPDLVHPPTWLGRLLFRQVMALYARKDVGPNRGLSRRGRFALLWAAWKFARGAGSVPRLHAALPKGTFEQVERPAGPLSPETTALLTRYYQVKLESTQFCGSSNHGRSFWDGFDALVLTFPAILWLARAMHDRPRLPSGRTGVAHRGRQFRLQSSPRHPPATLRPPHSVPKGRVGQTRLVVRPVNRYPRPIPSSEGGIIAPSRESHRVCVPIRLERREPRPHTCFGVTMASTAPPVADPDLGRGYGPPRARHGRRLRRHRLRHQPLPHPAAAQAGHPHAGRRGAELRGRAPDHSRRPDARRLGRGRAGRQGHGRVVPRHEAQPGDDARPDEIPGRGRISVRGLRPPRARGQPGAAGQFRLVRGEGRGGRRRADRGALAGGAAVGPRRVDGGGGHRLRRLDVRVALGDSRRGLRRRGRGVPPADRTELPEVVRQRLSRDHLAHRAPASRQGRADPPGRRGGVPRRRAEQARDRRRRRLRGPAVRRPAGVQRHARRAAHS